MKKILLFTLLSLFTLISCSQEDLLNKKFSSEFKFNNKPSKTYIVETNQTEFLDNVEYINIGEFKLIILNNEIYLFDIKINIYYITNRPNIFEVEILKKRFVERIVNSLSLYFCEKNNYTNIRICKPIEVKIE